VTSGLVTPALSSAHLNPGFGTINYLARPELQIEALKHAALHLALLPGE
jgi:hypothetical protein